VPFDAQVSLYFLPFAFVLCGVSIPCQKVVSFGFQVMPVKNRRRTLVKFVKIKKLCNAVVRFGLLMLFEL